MSDPFNPPLSWWQRLRARIDMARMPDRVIRDWEHQFWGDRIEWMDPFKIAGWLDDRPSPGDHLLSKRQSGAVRRYVLTRVEYMYDPRDMFFADLRFIRVEPREKARP